MSTTISNFCFVINSRFEWHVMLQHFEVFKLSKDITCENKKRRREYVMAKICNLGKVF